MLKLLAAAPASSFITGIQYRQCSLSLSRYSLLKSYNILVIVYLAFTYYHTMELYREDAPNHVRLSRLW